MKYITLVYISIYSTCVHCRLYILYSDCVDTTHTYVYHTVCHNRSVGCAVEFEIINIDTGTVASEPLVLCIHYTGTVTCETKLCGNEIEMTIASLEN
jgi:hypothetical protein